MTEIKRYQDIVQVAMFCGLIAALGLTPKIDLPFVTGVPITIQTLGVMLAGLFLRPRQAILSVCLFILLIAAGAPFLSGGRGGLGVLFGPGAGFLFGWVLGAGVVSFCFSRLIGLSFIAKLRYSFAIAALIACLFGGVAAIYLVGIPWLAWRMTISIDAAALLSLAFVPGDLIKVSLAGWIAHVLRREVSRRLLPA